jgi:glyoxylase-like metal-dependent hydrolase (beta-lactamase superfamily II)
MFRHHPETLVQPVQASAPAPGEMIELAEGVLWLRLPLPYRLDHVNVFLIEDNGGWAVLDTGLCDEPTQEIWASVLESRLGKKPLTRLVVTHFHPDHVGLAGWLTERFEIPLYMSQTEYLFCEHTRMPPSALTKAAARTFYERRGLDHEATMLVMGRGHEYLHHTTSLPPVYRRLRAGGAIEIGGRALRVLTGAGHAPEMVMLLCRADGLFFAADQVLGRISPNVSVWPLEPEADPLGDYLESLQALRGEVPEDVLVLAAHDVPFRGLHSRLGELAAHHRARCEIIAEACGIAPRTVAELVRVVFHRPLDAHQTGFAFGEVLAHTNYMVRRGELREEQGPDGVLRVRACSG